MRTLLEEEYSKLKTNNYSSSGECNIINNIIQIKIQESELKNIGQDFSVDVKKYLNSLIKQAEEASIGYDTIEVKKVKEVFSNLPPDETLIYIDYFIRQLQKSSFDSEIKNFQKLKNRIIITQSFKREKNQKIPKFWNFLIFFPQYNILCLFATLLFIGLALTFVLLPAPFKFMEFLNFDIKYQNITSNFILNHFLNFFGAFVGIDTDFKITPLNSLSMIIFIVAKIFSFIFVVNYLFNKLGEFLKR